mmetsp:Transcript_14631/g.24816  ORF Transcript_14631/g.24816 Transcript_14631/m.24816 type:complete len:263 (-) Transcript_14631:129-917(-)
MAADLGKEFVRAERERRDAVPALGLLEHRRVRFLKSHQPSHEVIHVNHGHLHVRVHGAHVGTPRGQAEGCLLVGRGQDRVQSVLGRAVAPHRVVVQHPRQDGEARVAAVLGHKPRHELATGPLLSPVVGAGVLLRVFMQPARGNAAARRRGAEGADRVGEADAFGANLGHGTQHILHPSDCDGLGHGRVHGCFNGQGRGEVPHRGGLVRVLVEKLPDGLGVAHVNPGHARAGIARHDTSQAASNLHSIRGDHTRASLRQRGA